MNELLFPVALLIAAGAAAQAGAQSPSGPPAGMPLKPIRVYAPIGERAGQEYDVAAEIGQAPAAILFLQTTDRGFLRQAIANVGALLRVADERALTGLQTHIIQLVDDRSTGETFVKNMARIPSYRRTVLNLDGAEGPGDYALSRKCLATLVLCKDGEVVHSHGFTQLRVPGRRGGASGLGGDDPFPELISKVAPPLPGDPEELREVLLAKLSDDPAVLKQHVIRLMVRLRQEREQLQRARERDRRRMASADAGDTDLGALRRRLGEAVRAGKMTREEAGEAYRKAESRTRARSDRGEDARMRRDERRDRADDRSQGKAPNDERLAALMRKIVVKSNSEEDIATLFDEIDERVGDDPELRQQAIDMFKLIRKLNYGNDGARERAKRYIDEHGRARRIIWR